MRSLIGLWGRFNYSVQISMYNVLCIIYKVQFIVNRLGDDGIGRYFR